MGRVEELMAEVVDILAADPERKVDPCAWEQLLGYKRGGSCSVCTDFTELACSDCRMNFKTTVYVCSDPGCRDEHELKCYGCKP